MLHPRKRSSPEPKPTSISPQSNLPSPVAGKKIVTVEWAGSIAVPETGDYLLGMRGIGMADLSIDGKRIADLVAYDEAETATGRAHLVQGQKAALTLHYRSMPNAAATATHMGKGG